MPNHEKLLVKISVNWVCKLLIIYVWGVDSILGWGPKGLKAHTKKDGLGPSLWIIKGSVPPNDSWEVLDMPPTLKLSSEEINMGDLEEYKGVIPEN